MISTTWPPKTPKIDMFVKPAAVVGIVLRIEVAVEYPMEHTGVSRMANVDIVLENYPWPLLETKRPDRFLGQSVALTAVVIPGEDDLRCWILEHKAPGFIVDGLGYCLHLAQFKRDCLRV